MTGEQGTRVVHDALQWREHLTGDEIIAHRHDGGRLPLTASVLSCLSFVAGFQVPAPPRAFRANKVPGNVFDITKLVFSEMYGVAPCANTTATKRLLGTARVLAGAERLLRPADQLDYVMRRWLTPITFEQRTPSMPHEEASIRPSGLSSDIQASVLTCNRLSSISR
jgi:hypothetical protein